jgi:hypothetical protein
MLGIGLTYKICEAIATNPSQGFEYTIELNTRPILLDFRIKDSETAI